MHSGPGELDASFGKKDAVVIEVGVSGAWYVGVA